MDNVEEAHPPVPEAGAANKCAGCGVSLYRMDEQHTPLCEPCREKFIRYPFPVWVKIFGGAVLALLLIALSTLPRSMGVGIHYKRGQIAEEKHNYLTAQHELEEVVRKEPSFTEARGRLLIAAFYNEDFEAMSTAYKYLEDKKIEDEDLYNQLSHVTAAADSYFPTDSFNSFMDRYTPSAGDAPVADYYAYLSHNPRDNYARLGVANLLYNQKDYAACDSLLNSTLWYDDTYIPALALKMPLKREMQQLDSSILYSDRLLAINREYTYAYASRVKALLKQKKDREALQWAKKGIAISAQDAYMQACLALAYHYNNDPVKRDAILSGASADSATQVLMATVKEVVTGKEKFRD